MFGLSHFAASLRISRGTEFWKAWAARTGKDAARVAQAPLRRASPDLSEENVMNQRNRFAVVNFGHDSRYRVGMAIALACSMGAAQAQQDFNQAAPTAPPAQYRDAPMQQQRTPMPLDDAAYADPNYSDPNTPAQGYPNAQTRYPDSYNQGQPSAPAASGYGQAPGNPATVDPRGNPLQQLVQAELQDFGIAPQSQLQTSMHGPTPTSIPGGQVITTDRLLAQIQQGQQSGLLIFHVLGQGDMIPGAQYATPASQAGTFSDQTQQEFGNYLGQVTQGRKDRPMVFYCLNTQCWMSYNAALRAINMGYRNVFWYRGGIEAWQRAQQIASSMQPQSSRVTAPDVTGGNPYRQ